MSVVVVAAADRFVTRTDWLESWHSFSYGAHFDPGNTGFAGLVACNEDLVQGGAGFEMHAHADTEIVTWVLSGALAHEDSAGNRGLVVPGTVQRTSAGSGIRHAEVNASPAEPLHLVQMWVAPDEPGTEPSYVRAPVDVDALAEGWVAVVAGGAADGVVPLGRRGAVLWVRRPTTCQRLQLPAAPFVHLLVACGSIEVETVGTLSTGDALRCTDAGALSLTATQPAELLAWELTG